jgi:hypothetical protein
MDGGSIVLCVLASLLALRVLWALMKAHEQKIRRELAIQAANAQRAAMIATVKPSEPPGKR